MEGYAEKLLILLKSNPMTLYEISKRLASGKAISHGTVMPIIRKLLDAGFIEYYALGRKKVYRLTEKGLRFAESLGNITDEVKNELIRRAMGDAFFYLNLLSSEEKANALNKAISMILPAIVKEVECAFRMVQSGKDEELKGMIDQLMQLCGGANGN